MSAIKNFFEFVNWRYESFDISDSLTNMVVSDRNDALIYYHNYLLNFGMANSFHEYSKKVATALADNIEEDPEVVNAAIGGLIKDIQAESKRIVKEYDPE